MHTLFFREYIFPTLKNIAFLSYKLFSHKLKGGDGQRKLENLVSFSEVTNSYNGFHSALTVFYDLIAGHHENLGEKERECFTAVAEKLSTSFSLYLELPSFFEEDDGDVLQSPGANLKVFQARLSDENLEVDESVFEIIKRLQSPKQ